MNNALKEQLRKLRKENKEIRKERRILIIKYRRNMNLIQEIKQLIYEDTKKV